MTRLLCAALLSTVALAGCGDSLITPGEGQPRQVTVMGGGGQQAIVGAALAESVVVRITDAVGRAIVRLPVSVNVPFGGAIAPAGLQTDGDGRVEFLWTLGPGAGSQSIEVAAGDSGHVGPKAVVSAMAEAGPPAAITALQGDQQAGEASQALADSLVVRITDGFGNHLEGVQLAWAPHAGSVNPTQMISDAGGRVAGAWTLGSAPGPQMASLAVTADPAISVSFTAEATPGPAPKLGIVAQPSDTVQSGAPFAVQPVIQLENASGAPLAVAGVSVAAAVWSGGATLGGTTSRQTDNNGLATFTDLKLAGPSGHTTLIFAASGYLTVTSRSSFIASRIPSPAQSTIAASPGSVAAGASASITVTARDAGGSPIPGVLVVLSASGTGNTLVQSANVTDAAGRASGSISSTVTETKVLKATVDGIALTSTGALVVVAGAPDASTTTANVPTSTRPFRTVSIVITTRDLYGNSLALGGYAGQLSVVVTGKNANTPRISDNNDGTYSADYLAFFKGTDSVAITVGGQPLPGSPYAIKVK
jgi:adhesin/invasin